MRAVSAAEESTLSQSGPDCHKRSKEGGGHQRQRSHRARQRNRQQASAETQPNPSLAQMQAPDLKMQWEPEGRRSRTGPGVLSRLRSQTQCTQADAKSKDSIQVASYLVDSLVVSPRQEGRCNRKKQVDSGLFNDNGASGQETRQSDVSKTCRFQRGGKGPRRTLAHKSEPTRTASLQNSSENSTPEPAKLQMRSRSEPGIV